VLSDGVFFNFAFVRSFVRGWLFREVGRRTSSVGNPSSIVERGGDAKHRTSVDGRTDGRTDGRSAKTTNARSERVQRVQRVRSGF